MTFLLEICLASDDLAQLKINAQEVLAAGAQRIELCANMAEDGLTPSAAAVRLVKDTVGDAIELLVMLRPVGGHFCYSAPQVEQMLHCMIKLAAAGADGVVVGALDHDHQADYEVLALLLSQAKSLGLSVTFHRAFDAIHDRQQALEQFIQLGVDRVLTSGTGWMSGQGAEQGVQQLKEFLDRAGTRLEIVVGGGVNLSNITFLKDQLAGGTPLDRQTRKVSFHVYSAVLTANQIDQTKVATMMSCLTADMTAQTL